MNEQFLIYLWSISDGIKVTMIIMPLIGLLLGFFFIPLIYEMNGEDKERTGFFLKKLLLICSVITLFGMLIPCKQDLALIFLYPSIKSGTQQVIQSDTAKKMYEVVNLYLDKQIRELK